MTAQAPRPSVPRSSFAAALKDYTFIRPGIAVSISAACLIAALALLLPVWAAALVVAVAYGVLAAGLALAGRRQLEENVPPTLDKTEKTMKENVEWAKNRKR